MPWLYKQKGSNNWWIGYRQGGRQVLRSTGTADRHEAEKQLAQVQTLFAAHKAASLTEELFHALTGKHLPQVTLKAALEDWLAECRGSTSEKTFDRYEGIAENLAASLHATDTHPLLRDVTTEQLRSFLTQRRATHSAGTMNLERRILATFFLRAVRNGVIRSNPMLPVRTFKPDREERQRRRAFSIEEIGLIYAKAPNEFWRFMILGGFYTGLRMGDLIVLRWGSVDFTENMLRLTMRKTSRPVHIPIAKPLRGLLDDRHRAFHGANPADWVWPDQAAEYERNEARVFSNQFYDLVLTPCGLAPARSKNKTRNGRNTKRQLNPVSFHSLRHSFVSFLKITGGNQAVAKELAGHASDMVSDLYTHLPIETLSQAIEQLPKVVLQ